MIDTVEIEKQRGSLLRWKNVCVECFIYQNIKVKNLSDAFRSLLLFSFSLLFFSMVSIIRNFKKIPRIYYEKPWTWAFFQQQVWTIRYERGIINRWELIFVF